MPFYTELRIRQDDTDSEKKKKRRTASKLKQLRAALERHIDENSDSTDSKKTVKIATWNLREFGGSKYKGRDYEPLYYIAETISHFDLVALQEVRSNLNEFFSLKRILGPDWSFIATDVTDGRAGNGERMVFLYNRKKVRFRNIAGELTLEEGSKIKAAFGERIILQDGLRLTTPAGINLSDTYEARIQTSNGKKKLASDLEIPLPNGSSLDLPEGSSLVIKKGTEVESPAKGKATVEVPQGLIQGDRYNLRFPEGSFDDSLRQFARTPFLMSFQSGWLKINLCTVHIYYGDASDERKLEQRRSEIEMLTMALADKAKGEFREDEESFLGVLGDFNIIGAGHPTMEALESNDFIIPEQLKTIPGSNVRRDKAYDQIAFWKPNRVNGYARLDIKGASIFDFFEHVFRLDEETLYRSENDDNGLSDRTRYSTWRTYKMSDHLPMWVELRTDFGEEYLETIDR